MQLPWKTWKSRGESKSRNEVTSWSDNLSIYKHLHKHLYKSFGWDGWIYTTLWIERLHQSSLLRVDLIIIWPEAVRAHVAPTINVFISVAYPLSNPLRELQSLLCLWYKCDTHLKWDRISIRENLRRNILVRLSILVLLRRISEGSSLLIEYT